MAEIHLLAARLRAPSQGRLTGPAHDVRSGALPTDLSALPWGAARRAGLRAVTFPGFEVKFAELLALGEGAEVVERKGRRLIWSRRALGPLKDQIIAYWSKLAGS